MSQNSFLREFNLVYILYGFFKEKNTIIHSVSISDSLFFYLSGKSLFNSILEFPTLNTTIDGERKHYKL
jgi:hypothetical protein